MKTFEQEVEAALRTARLDATDPLYPLALALSRIPQQIESRVDRAAYRLEGELSAIAHKIESSASMPTAPAANDDKAQAEQTGAAVSGGVMLGIILALGACWLFGWNFGERIAADEDHSVRVVYAAAAGMLGRELEKASSDKTTLPRIRWALQHPDVADWAAAHGPAFKVLAEANGQNPCPQKLLGQGGHPVCVLVPPPTP